MHVCVCFIFKWVGLALLVVCEPVCDIINLSGVCLCLSGVCDIISLSGVSGLCAEFVCGVLVFVSLFSYRVVGLCVL